MKIDTNGKVSPRNGNISPINGSISPTNGRVARDSTVFATYHTPNPFK